jgi:hypothetical protein
LNNKQVKVLRKIFEDPLRSDIAWKDIEKLLSALGGEITQGTGSRVRIYLNERIAIFHRPHPEKVTDKGALKSVREFILNSNIDIGKFI